MRDCQTLKPNRFRKLTPNRWGCVVLWRTPLTPRRWALGDTPGLPLAPGTKDKADPPASQRLAVSSCHRWSAARQPFTRWETWTELNPDPQKGSKSNSLKEQDTGDGYSPPSPISAGEEKAASHWLFTSPPIKPVSVKKYQLSPSATLSRRRSRQLARLPSQPTCLWYPSASGYRDIWKLLSSRAYHKPIYII